MQFDVHRNRGESASRAPYFVDVQHDHVQALRLRVVVPLVHRRFFEPVARLNPAIEIGGETFHFSTSELFAIDDRHLREVVANIEHRRNEIIAALDLLFAGI